MQEATGTYGSPLWSEQRCSAKWAAFGFSKVKETTLRDAE